MNLENNELCVMYTFLYLATEQQLTIFACSLIAKHAQIVGGCSVADDNHAYGTTPMLAGVGY